MIQYLLGFFFFLMYAGDELGMTVSLGTGLSLKNLLLYSIFTGIAISAAVTRTRSLELLSVIVPFVLIIIYALVTWVAAAFIFDVPHYEVRASFIRLKSSLGDDFLTFLVFFYGVMRARDAHWLMRTILWIAIAGNIVTLIDAFDVPNLNIVEARPRDERFLGFIGSANDYGTFLALFLPPTVALYMGESGVSRKIAAIGLFATAFCLLLTLSRGAYVAVIAGSVISSIYLRHHIRTQKFWRYGLLALSLFMAMVLLAFALGYADLFLQRIGRFEGSAHLATSGRSTIWANALEAMLEKPITFLVGNGYNAYESSIRFYAATHNHYLNYLYNLGAIGLALFLLVFIRIISTARSAVSGAAPEVQPYLLSVVFGVFALMVSQFFSEYHSSGLLIMAYLGVTMRLAVEAHTEEARTVPVFRKTSSPTPA